MPVPHQKRSCLPIKDYIPSNTVPLPTFMNAVKFNYVYMTTDSSWSMISMLLGLENIFDRHSGETSCLLSIMGNGDTNPGTSAITFVPLLVISRVN